MRQLVSENVSRILSHHAGIFSDYVGFIKKIMKLMQHEYPMLAKIEVQLTQEKEMDSLPNRPSKTIHIRTDYV